MAARARYPARKVAASDRQAVEKARERRDVIRSRPAAAADQARTFLDPRLHPRGVRVRRMMRRQPPAAHLVRLAQVRVQPVWQPRNKRPETRKDPRQDFPRGAVESDGAQLL